MGMKHMNQISIIIILLIIELCESKTPLKVEDTGAGGQCIFLISNSMALDFHHLKTFENK